MTPSAGVGIPLHGLPTKWPTMLRETGLHAGLALGLGMLIGAITQFVALGAAVGLLAAALVTHRWPPTAPVAARATTTAGEATGRVGGA